MTVGRHHGSVNIHVCNPSLHNALVSPGKLHQLKNKAANQHDLQSLLRLSVLHIKIITTYSLKGFCHWRSKILFQGHQQVSWNPESSQWRIPPNVSSMMQITINHHKMKAKRSFNDKKHSSIQVQSSPQHSGLFFSFVCSRCFCFWCLVLRTVQTTKAKFQKQFQFRFFIQDPQWILQCKMFSAVFFFVIFCLFCLVGLEGGG